MLSRQDRARSYPSLKRSRSACDLFRGRRGRARKGSAGSTLQVDRDREGRIVKRRNGAAKVAAIERRRMEVERTARNDDTIPDQSQNCEMVTWQRSHETRNQHRTEHVAAASGVRPRIEGGKPGKERIREVIQNHRMERAKHDLIVTGATTPMVVRVTPANNETRVGLGPGQLKVMIQLRPKSAGMNMSHRRRA